MSIQTNFSNQILSARCRMKMTQEQAAEGLNVSTRWFQEIESGRVLPGADLLLEIIAFFEIEGKDLQEKEETSNWYYIPVKEKRECDGLGEINTFGISILTSVDNTVKEIDYISDISTDFKTVHRLSSIFTEQNLSPEHFQDVIEDFLVDDEILAAY